jgi:protein-S-isoprenylcysteine O-methyltransferase Ste14
MAGASMDESRRTLLMHVIDSYITLSPAEESCLTHHHGDAACENLILSLSPYNTGHYINAVWKGYILRKWIVRIPAGKLIAQIIIMFVFFAFLLFSAAGTVYWLSGWIFLILFFLGVIAISIWLFKTNPELLYERMTGLSKSDRKEWDKSLMRYIGLLFILWLGVMPLDAIRFHLSHIPVFGQAAGMILLLCSFSLFYLTFNVNTFLSPAARIQIERGQKVITTGPYSIVRHPLYAGFLIFIIGTTLLLGSWIGFYIGLLLIYLVAKRAVREEEMLCDELCGYKDYKAKVKYRLIPFLW